MPGLGKSYGIGNGNPLQYSCLENFMDRGACRATVHGSQSQIQLSTHTHTQIKIYMFFELIFLLKDNCSTEFCCLLSNLNMSQL